MSKYTVKAHQLSPENVVKFLNIIRELFPEYRYITMAHSGMMLFMALDDGDEYIHWLEFSANHLFKRMFKQVIEAHGTAILLTKIGDLFTSKDPVAFIEAEYSKIKVK